MTPGLISVVIPTFNRASIIRKTIDNVFEQSYERIEVVIVDDGSTDDTQSVLETYGDRIRLITQKNSGPAVARNRGAEAAKGEIIAFQDSDDLWNPMKLERQVALLTKYGKKVPCCLCNASMGKYRGRELTSFDDSLIRPTNPQGLWTNVLEVLATRFVLFNQTVAVWRETFMRIGGFRDDLRYMEDYDLPLRLAFEGPWALISEPLVIYQRGTAESFSERALSDQIVLRECAVKIFEHTLSKAEEAGCQERGRRLLQQRLYLLRRQLRATCLEERGSLTGKFLARTIKAWDHYLFAAFRRSPWFPQPIVEIS
jgi:glycosyltransferase involved in cell wall biosynthesis